MEHQLPTLIDHGATTGPVRTYTVAHANRTNHGGASTDSPETAKGSLDVSSFVSLFIIDVTFRATHRRRHSLYRSVTYVHEIKTPIGIS